jgi:hypothetical protein
MDRLEATLILMGVEQRQLLMTSSGIPAASPLEPWPASPCTGSAVSSKSRVTAFGGRWWLLHHRSTEACPSRISVRKSGAFSQRDIAGEAG